TQRIILSFVCALGLILTPLTHGALLAQSNSAAPSSTQQDRTDVNESNQTVNPDSEQRAVNQDRDRDTKVQEQNETREKPAYPTTTQNRDPQTGTKNTTQSTTRSTQSTEQDAKTRDLPKTASNLPLLAVFGFVSLLGAAAQ